MKPLRKQKRPAILLILMLSSFLIGAHCRGRVGLRWWLLKPDGTLNRKQENKSIPVSEFEGMFCTDDAGVMMCKSCLDSQ